MTDDPTRDQAGQPCVGPAGHVSPAAAGDQISALIPDFPDVRLLARAAVIGERCTGLRSTVTQDWGTAGPGPHLAAIAVFFDPPRAGAPFASITGVPGASGEIIRSGHNGEGLTRAGLGRLVAAYERILAGAAGPLSQVDRPHDVTAVTRTAWERALAELKPQHRRQDELLAAMARRLYIAQSTARRYHRRGWPL